MTWTRLDDAMGEHRKVRRTVTAGGLGAFGLHTLAVLHASRYLTDGYIEPEFVEETFNSAKTKPRDRERILAALEQNTLWTRAENGGWLIHDYLDHNPSRAEVEEKRRKDAERKANGRKGGVPSESARTDDGIHGESARPTPTPTPVPSHTEEEETPMSPKGEDLGWQEWIDHHVSVTGGVLPQPRSKAYKSMVALFRQRRREGYTVEDLKLATVGGFNDPYRRDNGYYTPDSVLRPTKVHGLIEKGRRGGGSGAPASHGQNVTQLKARCADCGASVRQGYGAYCEPCSERRASA